VTSFSANFSGSIDVGSFSFGTADLQHPVYRLDGGQLGDHVLPLSEGIFAASANFSLLSGMGGAGEPGGFVFDLAAEASATTASLVTVSAVPEPRSLLLMVGGLALLGVAASRARSTNVNAAEHPGALARRHARR
jgi:hypothetical protein